MSLTIRDKLAIALIQRGERRIEDHASAIHGRVVFTCSYWIRRGSEGQLVPCPMTKMVWLLGENGSMRKGSAWTNSSAITEEGKRQLLDEFARFAEADPRKPKDLLAMIGGKRRT
jgi:hypothetical protein